MRRNSKVAFWEAVSLLLFSIILFVFAANETTLKCPPNDEIPNCKCSKRITRTTGNFEIYCSNFTDKRTFAKQMSKFSGMNITVLMLKNLTMPYLPSGAFKGMRVKVLEIYDGKLPTLAHPNDGNPFEGLEDSMTSLYGHRIHSVELLDFAVLSAMKKLERIDFQFTSVETFDNWHALSNLTNIKYFTIADTNMTALEKNALSNMKNLSTVILIFNKLQSVRRDFFPKPAPNLANIMLGNNKIDFVPDDTFKDMPKLRYVDLANNKLTTISQYWFQAVWPSMSGFRFRGNPLHCDTSLSWLTQMIDIETSNRRRRPRFNDLDYLKCSTPPKLANRTLKSLSVDELEFDINNNNRLD